MAGKRRAESSQALTLRAQEIVPGVSNAVTEEEALENTSYSSLDIPGSPSSCPSSTGSSYSSSSCRSKQSIGVDHCLLTKHVSSVFAALFNNGRILGIPCGIQVPILSRPCTAKVPLSLRPTHTQMHILHIPWIDRFPFPKMRDSVIQLSGIIDEEEFLGDLFTTDSFTILPGSVSWDPMRWIVAKPFEEKWGYLFY